jgi:hypothetical protein
MMVGLSCFSLSSKKGSGLLFASLKYLKYKMKMLSSNITHAVLLHGSKKFKMKMLSYPAVAKSKSYNLM